MCLLSKILLGVYIVSGIVFFLAVVMSKEGE